MWTFGDLSLLEVPTSCIVERIVRTEVIGEV